MCIPAEELGLAEGVHENAVATRGDEEGDGRVRVAGVSLGIGVDADDALLAALVEGEKLKAEAVHLLAGSEGKGEKAAPSGEATEGLGEGWSGDGLKLLKAIGGWGNEAIGDGGVSLRLSEASPPDAGMNLRPRQGGGGRW